MISTVGDYLKRHGFQVIQNKDQAQKLSNMNDDLKRAISVAGGVWIAQNTSAYLLTNNTLLLRYQRDSIAENLNGPVENEAFVLFILCDCNFYHWVECYIKYLKVNNLIRLIYFAKSHNFMGDSNIVYNV